MVSQGDRLLPGTLCGKRARNVYEAVTSSDKLVRLLSDHPQFIQAESPFYWAMGIAHGFNSLWWQDKD